MFFVQTSTLTLGMHQKLTEHVKYCMQNNQLPTITLVKLMDDSNINPFMYTRYTNILDDHFIG